MVIYSRLHTCINLTKHKDNRLYKQKYQAPKKSKSVKKSKKNNGQEQVSSVPTDWELVNFYLSAY